MKEQKNKCTFHIIGDIIFIVLLILMLGIRGYNEYAWYEYLFFVFIPLAGAINDIIQRTKKR
jgi:hypothetical protein